MKITINDRCVAAAREFKKLQELLQQPTDGVTSAEVREQNQRNHGMAIRIAGAVADAVARSDAAEELIAFCTARNIPYEDKRQAEDG